MWLAGRRTTATAILLVVQWFVLAMNYRTGLAEALPMQVRRWGSQVSIYVAGAVCIWLIVLYVLDGLDIRAVFKQTLTRDTSFAYIRAPSFGTLLVSSVLLLCLQWASFKIGWLWSVAVQLTVYLFLVARRFENSEPRIESLREAVQEAGIRTVKGHALRAFRYKFSLAGMYLLAIESAASLLVILEAHHYGFYDSSLLVVVCSVGLAGGIPIYAITMLPYYYYSRKSAH